MRTEFWTDVGCDKNENDIAVVVEYESEYERAEPDVGLSAGYVVYICNAVVEETGKPYNYNHYEQEKWQEKIANNLND
tara:strand:- start:377 stop:610 length:234 start_codon:yes stop_codon:yes gene_type:complete